MDAMPRLGASECLEQRVEIRSGAWTAPTADRAPGNVQANLVILPKALADAHNWFPWAIVFRELSFGSGAWLLAATTMEPSLGRRAVVTWGRVVIGITALVYGVEHFRHSINVPGVPLDAAAGNPFQPDLINHGFLASPLHGNPQGLAVYVNGCAVQPTVRRHGQLGSDPDLAIDRMDLVGSNPVFGLNAVGGALSVRMKNRLHLPGW